MAAKLKKSKKTLVDPDDAPQLTQSWVDAADLFEGDKLIRKGRVGRPLSLVKREMLSLRVEPDVLAKLRASGRGWQTRLSRFLKDAVRKGVL
jgi:uncharacterized protein (DUF4415 family)